MSRPTRSRRRQSAPAQTETRESLVMAAERLFAEHGLDAVSMRQINREAGQANTSSIHYHFKDREDVIEAVLERRMSAINADRLKLLQAMRADGRDRDLHAVLAAYVRPLAAQAAGRNGGSNYVRFLSQAYASSTVEIAGMVRGKWDQSLDEVTAMARDILTDLPEPVFRERMARFYRSVVYALADRERDAQMGRQRSDRLPRAAFIDDLILTQTAALAAPVSAAE